MKALLLFVLVCLGAGCSAIPHTDRADAVSISLERTGCFGSCPSYVVSLYEDGLVKFEGRDFVARKGVFTKRVLRSAVARVFARAESIRFWELQDKYAVAEEVKQGGETIVRLPPTDLPTRYVTVRTATKTKRIEDYWGAPPELHELEKLIDTTADVSAWVRGSRK